jgi:curved DNA-binding protein CbpA
MKRSYYEILGVEPGAAAEEIERAQRLLVALAASTVGEAGEALRNDAKLSGYALDVLLDPAKRAAYDAQLAAEAKREVFVPGPDRYVPDSLGVTEGWWRSRTAIAVGVAVLALIGIGTYAQRLAASQREVRAQQAEEAAARAEAEARSAALRNQASASNQQPAAATRP